MSAIAKTAQLPFSDIRGENPSGRAVDKTDKDWFLTLRHARVPLHSNDRFLLLHGHPLLFRLGLYAVTERVLAGEPVVYLDGANTFDPFLVGRLARAQHQQPRKVLAMIHVARAYTCHQMERLVSDCLSAALDRYQARMAVVSGLFDTFYDQTLPDGEALQLFGSMLEAIRRLTQQGYTLICLCPPAPVLTRTSRRCLDQLRGQADRVIRVSEEQGVIRLQEESREVSHSWEIARSALEPAGQPRGSDEASLASKAK